jgi:hypothetical protein
VDRGLGSARIQVADSRTYIRARLWPDGFNEQDVLVCKEALGEPLEAEYFCVAAKWIREHVLKGGNEPIVAWAADVREPNPDVYSRVPEEMKSKIAMPYVVTPLISRSLPDPPRWIVLHAEPSLARAVLVMKGLKRRVEVKPVVELRVDEQRSLHPDVASDLERDLSEFDDVCRARLEPFERSAWQGHPWKLLHEEAKKQSVSSKRVALPSESQDPAPGGPSIREEDNPPLNPPPPAGPAKSDPPSPKISLHEGHRLAAESLAWLSRERPEAKTRREQYALLKICPVYKGLERPGFVSWERYLREVKQYARQHPGGYPDVVE